MTDRAQQDASSANSLLASAKQYAMQRNDAIETQLAQVFEDADRDLTDRIVGVLADNPDFLLHCSDGGCDHEKCGTFRCKPRKCSFI
jgi:hypothetical protein